MSFAFKGLSNLKNFFSSFNLIYSMSFLTLKQNTSMNNAKLCAIRYYLIFNYLNAVYLLACKNCGVQYVGSCNTTFRQQFINYKSCNDSHKSMCVILTSLITTALTFYLFIIFYSFSSIRVIDYNLFARRGCFCNIHLTHFSKMVYMTVKWYFKHFKHR